MDNEVKFRVQGGRFFGGGRFCFWGVLFGSSERGAVAAVAGAVWLLPLGRTARRGLAAAAVGHGHFGGAALATGRSAGRCLAAAVLQLPLAFGGKAAPLGGARRRR